MQHPSEERRSKSAEEAAIAALLDEVRAGVPGARDRLFQALYAELHRCAMLHMDRQPSGHTLQPTVLVHELYFRLRGDGAGPWNDREHYLRAASRAMHQILVDYARAKRAAKRKAKRSEFSETLLDRLMVPFEDREIDFVALGEVLEELRRMDAPLADAALLLIHTKATMEEAAKVAGRSLRSFERRWRATRAWILEQLS